MHHPHQGTPDTPAASGSPFTWVVGGVFLFVAAMFFTSSPRAEVPLAQPVLVAKEKVAPGARRSPMGEPASVVVGGFTHSCNECHRIFESPSVQRGKRVQHTHITLRHGMNDNCFNCHHRTDREKLVLYTGETLSFEQVPRLCAQCHGTVYRDWQRGTHGKTLGSWDASSGKQVRLGCNDCHDPHAPAYPGFIPLPAPSTLRMGVQDSEGGHEHTRHAPIPDGAAGTRHQSGVGTEDHP